MFKYIKPIILLLGIASEAYLIHVQIANNNGTGTKNNIMLLMHAALCAMFVWALIMSIKQLKK